MPVSLMDEYLAWSPGSRIELVDGQLVVGDSLTHSRLLLSQILRGWGVDAVVALAPELLWWEALSYTFGAPAVAHFDELNSAAMQHWGAQLAFEPEIPQHHGNWRWPYSELRQALRLAMFSLGRRDAKLGQSLGGGFVNRLGQHGFMPDILFYRGSHNRLYEYYLDGPAEVIVEFIQPGCEDYIYKVKRSHYQAAGVPEFWIIDSACQQIELFRLVEGCYQQQIPDAAGGYAVKSVPGLTFFPHKLWLDRDEHGYPPEETWFEVAADAPRLNRIPSVGEGVDWSRGLLKLPTALEPVALAFEDYIYWCPEAKFEFANGRPDIGGWEGIKGLTGMLLMTFGLMDVVKLAHPQAWVAALLQVRAEANDPDRQAKWWKLARETATFLRHHYNISRIAVVGDLVATEPLNFWSELVLVVWGLSENGAAPSKTRWERYTSPHSIVHQLSEQPRIRLVDASRELTSAEVQLLQKGLVEL